MYLESKPRSNLSALEKYLLRKIQAQSIDYFPINRAISLRESNVVDDDDNSDAIAGKVI